ncbi:pyridoxamine 5'-phosphate oxidase family protein [Aromatoleum sp.]|uniref:pyridoxamine 5'-phosphate oxidase family protein n=1 Tax=Aromatoleum sp. TaxID=2307007 RepID=UPI002FC9B0F3
MSTVPAAALDYLGTHRVMTLATHGSDGPWAAAVFYVSDGATLYFLSSPTSRHCRNISENPHVAATIHEDYADWPQIQGIQAEGVVREISGDDEKHARVLYGDKYPVVGKIAQAPAAIVKALAKVRWYRFEPQRMVFIDNASGFGHRDEIDCRS